MANSDIINRDISLQDGTLADFALDHGGFISRWKITVFLLNDKGFDFTVTFITRVHYGHIGDVAVANPPFMPMQDPEVAITSSR